MSEFERWQKEDLPKLLEVERPYVKHGVQAYLYQNGTDKSILVCHGFSESSRKMLEVVWHFYQMGFSVISFDMPGHGRSARLTRDTSLVHIDDFDSYVKAALDLANDLKGTRYLFGHSMGGAVAAVCASRFPNKFEKVVLSSPMIRPQTSGIPWTIAQAVAREIAAVHGKDTYVPGSSPYVTERFAQSAGTSEERFEWYKELRERDVRYQTVAPSVWWLESTAMVEEELARTKDFPECLILQCEEDAFVVNGMQDWFAKKTDAVVVPFSGVKHEIYNSTDDILAVYWKTIETFLE